MLPFLTGAPTWAVPSAPVTGATARRRAPPGQPASGQRPPGRPSSGGGRPLRAQRQLLGQQPDGAEAADPRPGRSGTSRTSSTSSPSPNPAEYGKLVKLSYAAINSVDPGAKLILGGLFAQARGGEPASAKPPLGLLRRRLPRTDVRADARDQEPSSTGVALHPVHRPATSGSNRTSKKSARAEGQPRRRARGSGSPSSAGARKPPEPVEQLFAKGPAGQARAAEGRLHAAEQQPGANGSCSGSTGSRSTTSRGACNFCDGSGLFGQGFVPKQSWYAYVKFAGGTAALRPS